MKFFSPSHCMRCWGSITKINPYIFPFFPSKTAYLLSPLTSHPNTQPHLFPPPFPSIPLRAVVRSTHKSKTKTACQIGFYIRLGFSKRRDDRGEMKHLVGKMLFLPIREHRFFFFFPGGSHTIQISFFQSPNSIFNFLSFYARAVGGADAV